MANCYPHFPWTQFEEASDVQKWQGTPQLFDVKRTWPPNDEIGNVGAH